MRMAGPDIVLFVIGALLFGGATYSIVASPGGLGGAGSAVGVFNVAFLPSEVEAASEQVASMRNAEVELEVSQNRVIAVSVVVTCTDAAGPAGAVAPFQLQVEAQGPGNLTGTGAGTCGTPVVIDIPVAPTPPPATVAGSTEAEAREALGDGEPGAATGTWTIRIAGSRGQSPPVGLPVVEPGGTVAIQVTEAQPQFSPVQR